MIEQTSQRLEFRYEWDRREFPRAHRATMKHAARGAWNKWSNLALVAMVAFVVYTVVTDPSPNRVSNARFFFLAGAMLLLFIVVFPRLALWLAARLQERHLGPDGRLLTATLIDEGYSTSNSRSQFAVQWHGMLKAVETPEFILLYQARANAFYLPLRAVPPDQLPAVRSMLREKLGDRAKLRDAA